MRNLDKIVNWVIESGKFTDWIMVVLTLFLIIPVLFLIEDRFNIHKLISDKKDTFKKAVNEFYKRINKSIQKYKLIRYLNSIDSTNELHIKVSFFKKNILVIESFNDKIEISNIDSIILTSNKFDLLKFKKSTPIQILMLIFDEIVRNGKDVKNFTNTNRLSEYLHSKYIQKVKVPNLS